MDRIAIIAFALFACACSRQVQVSSYEDCLEQYVLPADTQRGAIAGADFCRVLTDATQPPERVTYAKCMLPRIAAAGSDAGLQAAAAICRG